MRNITSVIRALNLSVRLMQRGARQHFVDNGNASETYIYAKQVLIDSFEFCSRQHRELAVAEQVEYKKTD